MSYKISIDEYLDRLAGKNPVPGGGSAAALVGAIGMALLSMAAKYAKNKYKNGAQDSELGSIIKFGETSRRRLRRLMLEDEKAYLRLSRMVEKGTSKAITKSYMRAAEVPLEVCTILAKGLSWCERLHRYCRTSIISDIIVAALLMEAGFLSAKYIVDINLCSVGDKIYTERIRRSLSQYKKSALNSKRKILAKIYRASQKCRP